MFDWVLNTFPEKENFMTLPFEIFGTAKLSAEPHQIFMIELFKKLIHS